MLLCDNYDKKQGLQHFKSVCLELFVCLFVVFVCLLVSLSSLITTAKLEENRKEQFPHWSLRLLFNFLAVSSLHPQIPLHLGVLNRQVDNITRMSAVRQRPPLIKR